MYNDCSVRRLVGYLFWNANNVDMSLKILMYFTYLHIIIISAITVYIYILYTFNYYDYVQTPRLY